MESVNGKFRGSHRHKGEAVIRPAWEMWEGFWRKSFPKKTPRKQEQWGIRNKMLHIFEYLLSTKYYDFTES